MGKTKKIGPTGGLGVRYGVTLRKRYSAVVTQSRKSHGCPRCRAVAVKRSSIGIWHCRKCDLTFAGGAYTPSTKLGVTAKRAAGKMSTET